MFALRKTGQFAGKTIAVIGAGRTGLATAPILDRLGARVILSDAALPESLGERHEAALGLGVCLQFGVTPAEALADAQLVVPSPGVPANSPILMCARDAGLPILSEIEIAYRIAKAPFVAVTGTNGKSTVTAWIARMLGTAERRAWVAGNIAAGDLKCTLIEAADQADEHDVIVAEISSFQLEWVERFRPRVGVLTNVKRDHLDRYSSFGGYAHTKARLFAAQRRDDVAVVNAVNVPARAIGLGVRSRVLWFDRGHCAQHDRACIRDGVLTVRYDGKEHALVRADALRVPGQHNVENALAAAGAAMAYGADAETVRAALLDFEGLPDRMEPVVESAGVAYINSSMTTNVDATVCSLQAVGRPVVLIAGGRGKGEDFSPLGAAIARYVSHLVLIGQDALLIEQAAWSAGFRDVSRAGSMDEAVEMAARRARPGDAVLLAPACASHDMYTSFEARGRAFKDAVHRVLAESD